MHQKNLHLRFEDEYIWGSYLEDGIIGSCLNLLSQDLPQAPLDCCIWAIFSAGFARNFADAENGQMRLRIEDIDHTRCRQEFYQAIEDDLNFMAIPHNGAVMVQSERMGIYQSYLDQFKAKGWIYPCHLTRRE